MKRTYEFHVETPEGTIMKDNIDLNFSEDATEEQIENDVKEHLIEWRNANYPCGSKRIL
jgi:hypothetical protein